MENSKPTVAYANKMVKRGIRLILGTAFIATALTTYQIGNNNGYDASEKEHENDGLVLTATGSNLSPRLDLTARFGTEEITMKDIQKYARELAPHHQPVAFNEHGTREDWFIGGMRYILLDRDNEYPVYPGQFKVMPQKINDNETSIKVMPGKDTEYKLGRY